MNLKYLRIVIASALVAFAPLIAAAVLFFLYGNGGKIYDSEAGLIFGVDVAGVLVMWVISFVIALPVFLWAVSRKEKNNKK
ncbi:MAG: hypothetical protein K2M07_07530 [Muribaculaceae bacterium]|nr:hypothetical protein [Muribaculaceae bacterium]